MTSLSPDTVRRIEDAAAALVAAGNPTPTNEQVRAHLGGGSLSHISPVMRAFRARLREQRAEQAPALPAELAQLLTGQLALLWQAAVKQADADTLTAREQADADIAQADQERDAAQATVARLESELAVLREVVAERDRLLQEVRALRDEALPLREQVARLNQFAEYRHRVVIEINTGTLSNLIREITVHGGDVTTRGIQLDAGLNQDGQELYDWLKATADSLLGSGGKAA